MKVLIIGCFNLFLHPYLEKYLSVLKHREIEYKVIYWNRNGKEKTNDENYVSYDKASSFSGNIFHKILPYLGFTKFVRNHLKVFRYDRIVFLASQTMFLFHSIAVKQYKGRYIFDYRDVTYEKYSFYKKIMANCIKNSFFTAISSNGFETVFPKELNTKFVLCHNAKNDFGKRILNVHPSNLIRLTFWGLIREIDYFSKFLKIIGNDKRFLVSFYGTGDTDALSKIIELNKYENVRVFGEYDQKDIYNIASNTDIVLNCYSNKSIQKLSLTIKMYESLMYGLPMIVQRGSYMDIFLQSNNVRHLPLDIDNCSFKSDDIFNFYKINNHISCDDVLDTITADQQLFYSLLEGFFDEK